MEFSRYKTGLSLLGLVFLVGAANPASAADEFPYDLETETEAAVLGSAAILFGLGLWADQGYEPLTPEEIAALDPSTINGFDRSATRRWSPGAATASDIMLYTTMAAPLSLMLTDQGSRQPGKLGVMYLETWLLQGALTFLAKNTFFPHSPLCLQRQPGHFRWPGRWKKLPGVPFIPATPRAPLPRWFSWPASSKNSTPIPVPAAGYGADA